jgi:hypothetical protein
MEKTIVLVAVLALLFGSAIVAAPSGEIDLSGVITALNEIRDAIVNQNPTTEVNLEVLPADAEIQVIAPTGPQGEPGPQGPPGPLNSVAFSAFNSVGDTIACGDCQVEFDTENYDYGNNYDTSLDRFVAPAAGVYHFDTYVEISNQVGPDFYFLWFKINGTEQILVDLSYSTPNPGVGSLAVPQASVDLELNQDDYVEVHVGALDYPFTVGDGTTFSGHQVY